MERLIVLVLILMGNFCFSGNFFSGMSSPSSGDTWTDSATGMEFVYVSGGCYDMGCGDWDGDCGINNPVHKVCMDGFWISKYEVTIDQYRQFLLHRAEKTGVDLLVSYCPITNDSTYSLSGNAFGINGDQPMVDVSWNEAVAFSQWLSDETGYTCRLPTEAEWEYAARSGGREEKYAGGEDVDSVAWYKDNSGGSTHVVGTKYPNGLGIYDMSGNVWEWCSDRYDLDYYEVSPMINPQGPSSGTHRVIRGGSWELNPMFVRCYVRFSTLPDDKIPTIGFRLLREK